jgi:hypothetical protein
MKNTVSAQLYLTFHLRDIFQNPHVSLIMHALKLEQVYLGLLIAKGSLI